jgi:hypothetical protein
MKRIVTVPNCSNPKSPWSQGAVVALLIVVVVSLTACSTSFGAPDGTWKASYFANPDRVWASIEITLIDLDYEITSENRPDGIIRATSEPSEDGTVILLAIDQVMRTEDQVHVYVKPSFVGEEGSQDPGLLKAASDAFMTALNDKLNG